MTSNYRNDFEMWRDWYDNIRNSAPALGYLRFIRNLGLAARRTELRMLENKMEDTAAMELYYLYNGDLAEVAMELWYTPEIPLYRSKIYIIYLMAIEWLRKNRKNNKNLENESLESK